MMHAEVVLDRFVKEKLKHTDGCFSYLGKLDVDRVEPLSLRTFLSHIQKTINEELTQEGVNASGGVSHPSFHFDYLDVSGRVRNAHAFQHEGFAFIAVTLPMAETIGDLSLRLSRSQYVRKLLSLDPLEADVDELHRLLFDIQLYFLVSHEYTHHIHQHDGVGEDPIGLWTEFSSENADGNLMSQAQELDADASATYLVLAHLLRGNGRAVALAQLGQDSDALPIADTDELLLKCFFLAALAFFCDFWRGETNMASIRALTHPPPPVRINYTIRVAQMWCGQNGSVPQSWFNPERFQQLFHAAADIIGETVRKTWDAQIALLSSEEGSRYEEELFEKFEIIRHQGRASAKSGRTSPHSGLERTVTTYRGKLGLPA